MDQPKPPQPPAYQVRCQLCNVTFPVGTKRCIHCGEKIGKPLFLPVADPDDMPILQEAEPLEGVEEGEARGGRFLRVGFTLVWLILAFVSAAVRSCQDG
jgi:hypothetical protein